MVDVTITIPNDKIDEFKLGFLRAFPKNDVETDLQCFKRFIRQQCLNYYRTGKILIAQETTTPTIDESVISED